MDLTLPDDLLRELQQAAKAENSDPESLLREMLRQRRIAVPRTAAEVRLRLYARARAYWIAHNMPERAALTDTELDEQFDFIDADDVPHLKSDNVPRRDNPLVDLIGILDTAETDLSTSVRETMDAFYKARYGRSD